MITHNGKYLGVATHHGMPIYAATMGGKMILDGKWLQPATKLAIVAAFCAEGTEVIRKTNDYLNRIDPQRALLLAGFINEDPMLVTSLVETSKTRWLVGDGKAWIQVPVRISTSNTITTIVKNMESASTFQSLFSTSPSFAFRLWVSNSKCICTINGTESSQINFNGIGKFEYNGKSWMVNGEVVNTYIGTPVIADSFCLYNLNSSVDRQSFSAMSEFNVKDIAHFVPCQHDNQAGMLDIISGTFYPNANTEGTFTIALTDKTTS